MNVTVRVATEADRAEIEALIRASVRGLQTEYTEAQREAALSTVFTVDSRLLADGTYFVAAMGGAPAGCGGWSFRKTLYGGDGQTEESDAGLLEPEVDAAKIRAIFVAPKFARKGLGGLLLKTAEEAAEAAGFRRFEMGSTLAGVALYTLKGYRATVRMRVPVGLDETIEIVRMVKGFQAKLPDPETGIGQENAALAAGAR